MSFQMDFYNCSWIIFWLWLSTKFLDIFPSLRQNGNVKKSKDWMPVLRCETTTPAVFINILARLDHQSLVRVQSILDLQYTSIAKWNSYKKNSVALREGFDLIQPSTEAMASQHKELISIDLGKIHHLFQDLLGIVSVWQQGQTVCFRLTSGDVMMTRASQFTTFYHRYQGGSDVYLPCEGKLMVLLYPWMIMVTDIEAQRTVRLDLERAWEKDENVDNSNYPAFKIINDVGFYSVQDDDSIHVFKIDFFDVLSAENWPSNWTWPKRPMDCPSFAVCP